jgi:hypothetical protein
MTLDEKEDLIQQLMVDIDAATAKQLEQGHGAAETSAEAATEGPVEEDFVHTAGEQYAPAAICQ